MVLIDCYYFFLGIIHITYLYRRYCKNPGYKSYNWLFLGPLFRQQRLRTLLGSKGFSR
jgi:hypothetical protein